MTIPSVIHKTVGVPPSEEFGLVYNILTFYDFVNHNSFITPFTFFTETSPSRLAMAKEGDEPGKLPKTLLRLFLPVNDDTAPRAADLDRGSESEEKEEALELPEMTSL